MKLKRMLLISIFILVVLTMGAVAAAEVNADSNLQTHDKDIVESANEETGLESSLNDENGVLEVSDEDSLCIADENPLKANPDDLNVNFPKEFECEGKDDVLDFTIYLPKNSKGSVSVCDENEIIQKFNLSDGKISGLSGKCNVILKDNAENDEINVKYGFSEHKIDITHFTVRYDDGTNEIEKSALVNITYRLSCKTELLWSESGYLAIDTPYDFAGTIFVEVDGKRYRAGSNIFHDDDNDILRYFVSFKKLDVGKHKVAIITSGSGRYPAKTFNYNVIVKPNIDVDEWKIEGHEKISLQLPKKAKGSLVIMFYNAKNKIVKKYSKKLKNGKVSFAVPKSFYGKFKKVVVKYSGKDYKVKKAVFKNVVIDPNVKVPKRMLQGEKKYVSINLPGKKGTLKIYVGQLIKGKYKTKVYSKKLVNGKAKISLAKLKSRYDSIKVKFIEKTKGSKKVSYTMYKVCDILKPLDVDFDSFYTAEYDTVKIKAYKAGAKPLTGKYISVKINGKFVKKVKTDRYGEADFKIPDKYKSKSNVFKLTAQYKKNVVSGKIRYYNNF